MIDLHLQSDKKKIIYNFNARIIIIIKKDELKFYSFGNVFFFRINQLTINYATSRFKTTTSSRKVH